MSKKILIIEDEASIADALAFALKKEHYDVAVASDGAIGLDMFRSIQPDLVILDLMLPEIAGEDVCREIRKATEVPIIIVSAKDTETDKVVVLELGADDYVTKPFSLREMVARVRGQLRRTAALPVAEKSGLLTYGPILVNESAHEVSCDGAQALLTPKEFDLLVLFVKNPGQVLTPAIILDRVWGFDYYGSAKTVNVYIKKLREKLGENGSMIKNVRGVGYKLELKKG
jgi:DNA-binding response OmpR family regulator